MEYYMDDETFKHLMEKHLPNVLKKLIKENELFGSDLYWALKGKADEDEALFD